MSPTSKKYDPAYAEELIRVAESDLKSAKFLARPEHIQSGGRPETTLYLVQPAIEKAIKAVICWRGKEVPFSHDLGALLTHVPDAIRPAQEKHLDTLTEFATIRRYEQGYAVVTSEDVAAAISAGEAVLVRAKDRCQSPH